jgi:hypothetical protein
VIVAKVVYILIKQAVYIEMGKSGAVTVLHGYNNV